MIATRKIFLGILVPALFLLCGRASATPLCPASTQVYVSSVTQIVCVNAAGNITVLLTALSTSNLGDIAFGPDGLLYFTDSNNAEVFRFDPKSSTAGTAATITLVASLPSGVIPTGLGFSSSNGSNNGDLYVNASTGVFLIPGVACFGCTPSLPMSLTAPAITFPSSPITAGGLAFDVFSKGEPETMTIVDTSGQILQSAFPFTSSKSLANVSKIGQGIFANFCGDTLVASGTTLKLLSFDVNTGKFTQSQYVDLGDTVQYFEVAADNTVYATTFSNGAGGIVSRVAPVKDASGVPSCSATPTVTQIAFFKAAAKAGAIQSAVANGVAIGPTSITITRSFSPTVQSQIYNFGSTLLTITYEQVLSPGFTQSFTAVRSRPADISFSAAFQLGTVPIHPEPLGGFAVQYVTPSSSNPGDGGPQNCLESKSLATAQYGPCPPDALAVQMKSAYSTDDFLVDPGFAQADGDTLSANPSQSETYTVDYTHDVWFADNTTGTSCTKNSLGILVCGFNSTYVDDNQAPKQTATVTIKSPVASCINGGTTPTCNPQFKLGQNVDFGVTLTPVPSTATLSAATIRLSIAQVHVAPDGTIQIDQTINVFSKNNADTDNFFKVGSSLNNYTYNWDSSGVTPVGKPPFLFQATIFSDSFSPVVVFLTGK